MALKKTTTHAQSPTTAQQLGSLVKSARDIMRKDKGLSGDLDRLPMLTWIMFLKFLDDMEQIEESRAKLGRTKYKPAIERPYRWRDWAAAESGITGPELLAFIAQEEAVRPDGTKGPGLFAYLRGLRARNGRGDRRTVVATVFQGVNNRMTSGYLLRDVINNLCQMNLLLHGLEYPRIDPENSLRFPLNEIGDRDRVDVILTNPPFGGEEERGILGNFPEDKQTAETALLFLQLIMRRLKRPGRGSEQGGRAAVVVPNGTLFGDGVCARIKEQLLTDFHLHTIVRLPNGVFAPYTSIPTNLLFFDRTGPTRDVWYYEIPLPEGRKNYTKTKPMQYEDFADCLAWYRKKRRDANDHAWKVAAQKVLQYNSSGQLVSCNLDVKNPNSAEALEHLPPEKLVEDILEKEQRIMELLGEVKAVLAEGLR